MTQPIDTPVWGRKWFQWMVVTMVGLAIVGFILPPLLGVVYAVRPVLLPVLVAVALAYIFNPPIHWLNRRLKLPRWAGTTSVLGLAGVVAVASMLLIVPPVISQGVELVEKLQGVYPQQLLSHLTKQRTDSPETPLTQDASWWAQATDPQRIEELLAQGTEKLSNLEWSQVYQFVFSSLDIGVGVVGSAISFTSYLVIAGVIVAFCFFFFSWKYAEMTAWFVPFIPARWREQTLSVIHKMDQSVAGFIRGRLIQAAVMGAALSIGWALVGVPYFLLLGLLSGLLNLVPFAAVAGCLAAVGLAVIDSAAGGQFTLWIIVWPLVVYVAAQLLDGWVVEPIVQGKATDLDPVSVLLVVMVGGAVAGLLGMLLAIPVAACIKILSKEVMLPKLRQLAADVENAP